MNASGKDRNILCALGQPKPHGVVIGMSFCPTKNRDMKRQLEFIEQLDQYGCTIACMAMIVGMSYFELREMMHRKMDKFRHGFVKPGNIGFGCIEFKLYLKQWFGISSEFIKFCDLDDLKQHCVLWIAPLTGPYTYIHAVVFDSCTRRILDPNLQDKIKNLDKHNVVCCIAIGGK